jgi:hypothetical protein
MRNMFCSRLALVTLTICAGSASGRCDELTAPEVVARLHEAFSWSEKVSLEAETVSNDSYRPERMYNYSVSYARNGLLQEWIRDATVTKSDSNNAILAQGSDYEILGDKFFVRAQQSTFDSTHPSSVDKMPTGTIARRDADTRPMGDIRDLGHLWGNIEGTEGTNICELLEEASDLQLAEDMIKVRDMPCLVLSCSTEYGDIEIVVAPSKGYNPIQYRIVQRGKQRVDSNTIDSWGGSERAQTIDILDFKKIDDRWVPVYSDTRWEMTYTDGRSPSRATESVRITDVNLSPDFEALGAFTAARLPDGTRLENADAPGVMMTVNDGVLVSEIDEPKQ